MNVTSGTINDNPWEGVVLTNQQQPQRAGASDTPLSTSRAIGTGATMDDDPQSERRRRQQQRFTCTDWTLHTLVQLFLGLDILGALIGLIYGLIMLLSHGHHHQHHDNGDQESGLTGQQLHFWPAILILELATLWGLRVLSVTGALYYSHILNLFGLLLAAYVSAALAAQTCLVSLLVVIYRHSLSQADWWSRHLILAKQMPHLEFFLRTIEPWLWLLLLGVAFVECPVRWSLYHQYRQRLLQQEEEDLQQTALLSRAATQRRPWWWSSSSARNSSLNNTNNNLIMGTTNQNAATIHSPMETDAGTLEQALLPSEESGVMEDDYNNGLPDWARGGGGNRRRAAGPPPPQGLFSSWFFWGGRGEDEHNPRDDGSVDFASVQEEWASRSEEDPLWWSRDNVRPTTAGAAAAASTSASAQRPIGLPPPKTPSPGRRQQQQNAKQSSAGTLATAATSSSQQQQQQLEHNPQEGPPREVPDFVNAGGITDVDSVSLPVTTESVISEM